MMNGGYNPTGMYMPQGSGFQFMGGQPQPQKINNVLTNEEIQRLITKENQFSLQLTETEVLRSKCNHRTADGLGDAIVEDANGISTCQICGYQFKPIDANTSAEVIQDAVLTILDMLQTIKLLYIDLPNEAASEYFQIIPLIEKIPKLFDYAVKDYAKHTQFNPYSYNNRNMSTMQLFNALCGTMNQGFQQPVMPDPNQVQQPYAAPGYMGAPGYGMPMSNGFGYNPATAGYQYNPIPQVAPAAAPTATEAAPTPATTVDATFKA